MTGLSTPNIANSDRWASAPFEDPSASPTTPRLSKRQPRKALADHYREAAALCHRQALQAVILEERVQLEREAAAFEELARLEEARRWC